jgi:hypothetical protein
MLPKAEMNFEIEKNNIIDKLKKYSKKIKLTSDYVNRFNYIEYFDKFKNTCKYYNKLINECILLKDKLSRMTKWGYILNIKKWWVWKLASIKSSFNSYSNDIVKLFTQNFKYKLSRIIDEDYVAHQIHKYEKLKIYLKTYEINEQYLYVEDNIYIGLSYDYLFDKN